MHNAEPTCQIDPNRQATESSDEGAACTAAGGNVGPSATSNLRIAKSNNVSSRATVGGSWDWTLTVTENGVGPAAFPSGATIVRDNLPNGGLSYGAVTVSNQTRVVGPGTIACSLSASSDLTCIASGGSVTIDRSGTFRVTVRATANVSGTFFNPRSGGECLVDPTSVTDDTNTDNNTCRDFVVVAGPPDLAISASHSGAATRRPGERWIWTVTVLNDGGSNVNFANRQTILRDAVPSANVVYGAVTTTRDSVSGTVTCSIDSSRTLACIAGSAVTIPPGATIVVRFDAIATAAGTYANPRSGGACLVDPDGVVTETNEGNNSCSDTVTVAGSPVPSDLNVSKSNNAVRDAAVVGQSWNWSVTVSNRGSGSAIFSHGQIILTDALPSANVTYGAVSITRTGTIGTLSCFIDPTSTLSCAADGQVAIPDEASFRVQVRATATAPGRFVNPRAGGICAVDPLLLIDDRNRSDNSCSNTVLVADAPDLTITASNNLPGQGRVTATWIWVLTVTNVGSGPATFQSGARILTDSLPRTGLVYGHAGVATSVNVSGPGRIACTLSSTFTLNCDARDGQVIIGPGGNARIAFTVVSPGPGRYANPRPGGSCQVDPFGEIFEANEQNNTCADTAVIEGVIDPPTVSANNDDDEEKTGRQRLTETARRQRERTNRAGLGDYQTEGNIVEVRCDASTPAVLDVPAPDDAPYLVVATVDGTQQLRLLHETRTQCASTRVGDYAEADGEKQTEQLFDVENVTIKRAR